ncbi:putative lipoprotein [Actinobacillus minor NM305]|uniref:Putative lipoprotein n=1 Tax=Actinobacillus minor NM305 TaxID=637911 RepID=C5S1D3_9PAST|nr:copper resistance protein NlpE [Actinobacillus minor]EER47364.1 putative lipoprotein [Actinobacillus minor NM305]MDY5105734.1 copper resistance protein NlpE [Actinobacillus minor]
MKKIAVITLATLLGACSMLPKKNVAGTYQGVLPCADCDKIQAELILNADNTYQYNTIYFKNSKEYAFTDKGKFTWDQNKSNVIRLEQDSGSLAFQVTDGYAEICDTSGNVVKNSQLNYKLLKVTK